MNLTRIAAFAFAVCSMIGSVSASVMPRYGHIFVIIAENKSYDQIIGSPNAPNLSKLAKEYGLATNFFGEVHPSEANYIAMLGGSNFGIHDDDAWYCEPLKIDRNCPHALIPGYVSHSLAARSLADQLEDAKLTWKGYYEDLPAPGSLDVYAPSKDHPDPNRPLYLYASKHNGFINFNHVREDPKIAEKIVPLGQLHEDLANGKLPNYAHIVLNQCNEMHGLYPDQVPPAPANCVIDRHNPATLAAVIQRGDKAIGAVIDDIMASPAWKASGNFAIVVTWDEDDGNKAGQQGCCGYEKSSSANFGGGHIATIVITNHGPRGVEDGMAYNHYSLLRTTEEAFGIRDYLGLAGASDKGVTSMTPLFATR